MSLSMGCLQYERRYLIKNVGNVNSIVIVTDIFGLCQSTDSLVSFLSPRTESVSIIEPYRGVRHSFKNEKAAYSAFVEKCGHDNYFDLVKSVVSDTNPDLLIGFSAGASVLWRLAAEKSLCCRPTILGFYPSRIREHLDVIPRHRIEIIFPIKEESFDVVSVRERVEKHENVNTEITPYDHGFMNASSLAYDEGGESFGLARINRYLDLMP
ncbi:hypothetical protein L4C36_22350 [Photobacterium japonica]|uniref:hypothetical protein n=1 Tax=Photobacterium japonica TaxID=2910235 RepID=UPI003D0C2A1E